MALGWYPTVSCGALSCPGIPSADLESVELSKLTSQGEAELGFEPKWSGSRVHDLNLHSSLKRRHHMHFFFSFILSLLVTFLFSRYRNQLILHGKGKVLK